MKVYYDRDADMSLLRPKKSPSSAMEAKVTRTR